MTHPERLDTRRADAAARAAADLPDEAGNRAFAFIVACLLTPHGYGDPVLVAEWILGDKPPIDKHLDNLRGEFLAPIDDEEALGGTDADQAAGWYTAAMGWKTRAKGAEAALARLRTAWQSNRDRGSAQSQMDLLAVVDEVFR